MKFLTELHPHDKVWLLLIAGAASLVVAFFFALSNKASNELESVVQLMKAGASATQARCAIYGTECDKAAK